MDRADDLLTYRVATDVDCDLLGQMNRQLIVDEGHRNNMTVRELEARMRDWLAGDYRAVIVDRAKCFAAYALFREMPAEVYLRQLFVARESRRQGIGRQVLSILRTHFWPSGKRLTVEVLTANTDALAFWRAMDTETMQ